MPVPEQSAGAGRPVGPDTPSAEPGVDADPGDHHPADPPARHRYPPYLLAAVLLAVYTAFTVTQYLRLGAPSWDLGIFVQEVRGYAHLHAPIVDIKGPGFDILGDHFSPIVAVLAPFYRLFPSPITVLVAQALLLALSVIPVTRVARDLVGAKRGLAIGVAYGLSWGLQEALAVDFHEICFAVPLLALSLEYLLRGRWRACAWAAVPLVLVKEDLGITVAVLAGLLCLRSKRARPALLAAFGLVATAVEMLVIMPAIASDHQYGYFEKLSIGAGAHTPWGMIGDVARQFVSPEPKLYTLVALLVPLTGALALRSPILLAAIPTLAWRFLSDDQYFWGVQWHYNATLMPIVFLALIDALARAPRSDMRVIRGYARLLPGLLCATAVVITAYLPLRAVFEPATYRIPPAAHQQFTLAGRIPDGTTVESDVPMLAPLATRCRVLWVGQTGDIVPDYIVLHGDPGSTGTYVAQLHPDAHYARIGDAGGMQLYRRSGGTVPH